MIWSDQEWVDLRIYQPEMASRLAQAGMEPSGWCNGKPEFPLDADWEAIQAICLGEKSPDTDETNEVHDESVTGSKRRKRK